jgi:hypothetical protein
MTFPEIFSPCWICFTPTMSTSFRTETARRFYTSFSTEKLRSRVTKWTLASATDVHINLHTSIPLDKFKMSERGRWTHFKIEILQDFVPLFHITHGQADKFIMFFENLSGIWGFGLRSLLWVVDPIIPSIDQPANR